MILFVNGLFLQYDMSTVGVLRRISGTDKGCLFKSQ